jgi:hypothetical protein
MASPFPGMDPFIEGQGFWRDFHASFIAYWRETLLGQLPSHYDVRIDEQVRLVPAQGGASGPKRPDVAVVQTGSGTRAVTAAQSAGGLATIEPVSIANVELEESRDTWLEIYYRPDDSLVSVLELLSPSNKTGPGRDQFLARRIELLRREVHVLELDLLLGGARLPLGGPLPAGDYFALLSRAERRPICDVYAWGLRQPLPRVPVPLRAPDADVAADLAKLFSTTYDRGGFGRRLRYSGELSLPLSAGDRAWAMEQARSRAVTGR